MKLSLGGKLTIFIAIFWAMIMAFGLLATISASDGKPLPPLVNYIDQAIVIVSFPLGWISGLFFRTGTRTQHEWITYLLLMLPNVFLWGYLCSGFYSIILKLFNHDLKSPGFCRGPGLPNQTVEPTSTSQGKDVR